MTSDLFEYFAFFGEKKLPTSFEPSFLQPLLEQESKYRPSRYLNLDPCDAKLLDARGFADVEQWANLVVPDNICFKMTINDPRNVPVPKKQEPKPGEQASGFSLEDVESRELRIILCDLRKNEYISNAHIIPASASEDGQTWRFGAVS